jgi:hypothetical protein
VGGSLLVQEAAHIRSGRGGHPPLTLGIPEMVDWACWSALLTDEDPEIAAWIAVQMAWETLG